MGRSQSRDHDVANDSGRFGGGGQRTLFVDDEGSAVVDAGNQRRVCSNNLGEKFVVGVISINYLAPPGLLRGGQRTFRNTRPVSRWHRRERP
jgi:hypothetical protein